MGSPAQDHCEFFYFQKRFYKLDQRSMMIIWNNDALSNA